MDAGRWSNGFVVGRDGDDFVNRTLIFKNNLQDYTLYRFTVNDMFHKKVLVLIAPKLLVKRLNPETTLEQHDQTFYKYQSFKLIL